MRNYKFRIYPNHIAEARLGAALEASRWLYNYLLSKNLRSKEDMQFALTELKEDEEWLRLYHSKMLQMIPHRIDSARKALKALRNNGHKVGELTYARRDEWNTIEYNQSGFKIERHGETDLLWLSKIGYIEIRLHRPINNGTIKQVTVTRKNGKWHACIVVVVDDTKYVIPQIIDFKKAVGIDVGIKNCAYDSDGNSTPNQENLRKMLKPLVRANRKMSRRVYRSYGSNNYRKAKRWYQIVHERIVNRRKDFLHKLSHYYATRYGVIFLEHLRINNMIKNHHLAMSIMDASWGAFKNMVDYKSKMMVEVEPYNTTVECSRCGNKVPKSLAVRTHRCDVCGLVLDRDHNASITIFNRGMALLGLPMVHREVTPVEISRRSRKQEAAAVVKRLPSHHKNREAPSVRVG